MHWITYLFPRTVVKTSSQYNRDIRVVEEALTYKLLVNGATETGPYIRKLLLYAFKKFNISKEKNVKTILVLGVAGGTIIHTLHNMYPQAQITGVDIDDVMIGLGKKYFGLNTISNLILIKADAKVYIQRRQKDTFDCIVIDLFIGREIPQFVKSIDFLHRVKKLLSPSGFVFINYLKELEFGLKPSGMTKALHTVFTNVRSVDCQYNRFFLAKKSS